MAVVTELNGHEDATTNNRMELTAAIEGLRATERGADVILRSDSRYVVNSMTLHYKRNTNHDLWEQLDAETAARRVRFEWVRGHGTDPINNRADELALMGANGRLVADGASPEKRKARTVKNHRLLRRSRPDDAVEAGRIDSQMRGMRREVRKRQRRQRLLLTCALPARRAQPLKLPD